MRNLSVLVLAACAQGQVAGSRSPRALADATHSLLKAYDRGDARAFEAAPEPSFVRCDSGRLHDRASELAKLKARPPELTRTWKDERVVVRATDATYIGLATEREVGNDSHGNREWSGWYTVSWVRDGSAWKAEWSVGQPAQPPVVGRWRDDLVDVVDEAVHGAAVIAVHEQEPALAHRFPASSRHCFTPMSTERHAPSWRTSASVSTTDQSSTIKPSSKRLIERHRRTTTIDDVDDEGLVEIVDPSDVLAVRRRVDLLASALADLDPLHREVILLRDIQELSAPEAAHQLGISIHALKSRLHRARVNLREHVLRRSASR